MFKGGEKPNRGLCEADILEYMQASKQSPNLLPQVDWRCLKAGTLIRNDHSNPGGWKFGKFRRLIEGSTIPAGKQSPNTPQTAVLAMLQDARQKVRLQGVTVDHTPSHELCPWMIRNELR
jgi:hypothetical protein